MYGTTTVLGTIEIKLVFKNIKLRNGRFLSITPPLTFFGCIHEDDFRS